MAFVSIKLFSRFGAAEFWICAAERPIEEKRQINKNKFLRKRFMEFLRKVRDKAVPKWDLIDM